MMKRFAILTLLFLAPFLAAQDVPLDVHGDVQVVTVVKSLPVRVKAKADGGLIFWTYPPTVTALDQGDVLEVTKAPKGSLTIGVKVVSAKLDKAGKFIGFEQKHGSVTISVGDLPKPPGPEPGPDPKPDPDPPSPAPITVPGLHALVIFETKDTVPSLNDVVSGVKTRGYMAQKGVKNGFLALDKDVNVSNLEPWVKQMWDRPRKTIPWLIISNHPKGGYEGEVPKDDQGRYSPDKTLELLKKFGG